MLYNIFIIIMSLGTIYNLIKRTELMYHAKVTVSNYISIGIMIIALLYLNIYVLDYNLMNYLASITMILFTYSGMISRGFNRRGIYNTSFITFLAKFSPWKDVKNIDIEYNADNYIDIVIATDLRAFRQRYKEENEETIRKIKKDLKI